MQHLLKTAISLALAAGLGLSCSSVIAASEEVNNTAGNEGVNQPDDADLDRIQAGTQEVADGDSVQVQESPVPTGEVDNTGGSEGTNLPEDADLDRLQDGTQASEQNEGSEQNSGNMYQYQYRYEEPHPKQGLAVDQNLVPRQTQTRFRARLLTLSDVVENDMIRLRQGDPVKLESEVNVDPEDIGKTAECLVVAEYQTQENAESRRYMLAENGWEEWDGQFENLTGKSCQLGQLQQIQAHEGELIPGEFKLHFGYQFAHGGIVACPEPISFTVDN